MRLLLHACCGPCLLEPLDELARAVATSPSCTRTRTSIRSTEYERRRDTLLEYAAGAGRRGRGGAVRARGVGTRRPGRSRRSRHERCRACFRAAARHASREHAGRGGFDAFATTLTVSPYQDVEALRDAAEAASADARRRVPRTRTSASAYPGDRAPVARTRHVPPELLRLPAVCRSRRSGSAPRRKAQRAAAGGTRAAEAGGAGRRWTRARLSGRAHRRRGATCAGRWRRLGARPRCRRSAGAARFILSSP